MQNICEPKLQLFRVVSSSCAPAFSGKTHLGLEQIGKTRGRYFLSLAVKSARIKTLDVFHRPILWERAKCGSKQEVVAGVGTYGNDDLRRMALNKPLSISVQVVAHRSQVDAVVATSAVIPRHKVFSCDEALLREIDPSLGCLSRFRLNQEVRLVGLDQTSEHLLRRRQMVVESLVMSGNTLKKRNNEVVATSRQGAIYLENDLKTSFIARVH